VATIRSQLRDRVTLQVRSVDCLFLQVYVPRLMSEGQLIRFLLDRGFPIPLPALLGKIGAGYKRALERFAQEHDVPVVRFGRRESKEEISRFGVVLIGVAQERARVWRAGGRARTGTRTSLSAGSRGCPTTTTCTVRNREWGRAFIKCCCYCPWPVWLGLNGHEWAKRQAEQAGLAYQPLDNGLRSCELSEVDAVSRSLGR
jgi:hypothetical protein